MGSVGDQTYGKMNGAGQPLDWSKFHNVIDGQLSATVKTRHGINSATGKHNPDFPLSTQEDVEKAMIAAKKGSKIWAATSYTERQKAVLAFADALEAEQQGFASMLTQEQGKPLRKNDSHSDQMIFQA